MTLSRYPRVLAAATAMAVSTISLTACSDYRAPGELGTNQEILTSCPTDQKLSTFILSDGTGSNRNDEITADRLATIERLTIETAVCGGHLTVSVYSAGSASTITVFDEEIALPGATENARLRRVPEKVEEVTGEITARYDRALDDLPSGGSDITAMWRLAAEQQKQLSTGYQHRFVTLTDGLDTFNAQISAATTPEDARAIAASVPVPDLSDAQVTVAGVGRVAGAPVPSGQVEALIAFYEALCEKSSASDCLVVTDWR